jgi:hypothetical protein
MKLARKKRMFVYEPCKKIKNVCELANETELI